MGTASRIRVIDLVDTQAGGDVSRIVLGGVGPLPGGSLMDQVRFLERQADGLRRLLLAEPYGDPAMSIDLVLPPIHPQAQAGYIIMEAMGYPVYSGSNTLCTATALLESGRIAMQEGQQTLTLESPAGLVHITAECRDGRVVAVSCEGAPAYVAGRDFSITLADGTPIRFDVVFSGGFYSVIQAEPLGYQLSADEAPALAALGHAFITAARQQHTIQHPQLGDIGPLSFVHFAGPVEPIAAGQYASRSATYVHPGVICRSPTGTGTSARLALMVADNQLHQGESLETISLRGSRFRGTVAGVTTVAGQRALRSTITGRAWTLAHSKIVVDLDDPLIDDQGLSRLLTEPFSGSALTPPLRL